MADLRKIKKEKGSVLVPGANRLRRGVNFAVEVPQGVQASLVLYKKNARKPSVEIPFTEKDRTGDICAVTLPDLKTEDYQYNFLLDVDFEVDKNQPKQYHSKKTLIYS